LSKPKVRNLSTIGAPKALSTNIAATFSLEILAQYLTGKRNFHLSRGPVLQFKLPAIGSG
jgi:hypothetical protein